MNQQLTQCLNCQHLLHGRTDKKFCNDYCRNAYNNSLYRDQNNLVRNISAAIKRNRRILQHALGNEPARRIYKKSEIAELGFDFGYQTHIKQTPKGNLIFYCFEYGYLITKNDRIKLIAQTNQNGFVIAKPI